MWCLFNLFIMLKFGQRVNVGPCNWIFSATVRKMINSQTEPDGYCVKPAFPTWDLLGFIYLCFVSSAAAKKAASSHPESSGEKVLKEDVNGEVEEEPNGKAKDGQEVASGSKPRVCRRAEASEASGPGELKALDRDRWRCYCGTGTMLGLYLCVMKTLIYVLFWEILLLCDKWRV